MRCSRGVNDIGASLAVAALFFLVEPRETFQLASPPSHREERAYEISSLLRSALMNTLRPSVNTKKNIHGLGKRKKISLGNCAATHGKTVSLNESAVCPA